MTKQLFPPFIISLILYLIITSFFNATQKKPLDRFRKCTFSAVLQSVYPITIHLLFSYWDCLRGISLPSHHTISSLIIKVNFSVYQTDLSDSCLLLCLYLGLRLQMYGFFVFLLDYQVSQLLLHNYCFEPQSTAATVGGNCTLTLGDCHHKISLSPLEPQSILTVNFLLQETNVFIISCNTNQASECMTVAL